MGWGSYLRSGYSIGSARLLRGPAFLFIFFGDGNTSPDFDPRDKFLRRSADALGMFPELTAFLEQLPQSIFKI